MSLLSAAQLRSIQQIGESGMTTPIDIYARKPYSKDSANPYGDDIVEYETTPVSVLGWVVTKPTTTGLGEGVGQVQALSTHQARVPVGTAVRAGDHVKIEGEEFVVVDTTKEQTWPEWTVLYLRGYEDAA